MCSSVEWNKADIERPTPHVLSHVGVVQEFYELPMVLSIQRFKSHAFRAFVTLLANSIGNHRITTT